MGRLLILVALACSISSLASCQDASVFEAGVSFKDCPDCPTMITLPAGRFIMGADDQRETYGPAHDHVLSKPFAIAVTETTFTQYEACIADGGCPGDKSDHGWGRERQPVINVSWQDAVDYTAWLSRQTSAKYRLPTEIEWDYAVRAGSVTRYPWGDGVGKGNANCRRCGSAWSGTGAAPVAQFSPNAFGLYDMNGNVSEWVADCWTERHQVSREIEDSCPARVTRGGDWYYVPIMSTSAARKPNAPNLWSYTIGFRVVRELTD
ncbi:MAG: SUMF1/EgtB/PvdO family nonheme iron enzyme [Alphaproteobacteria bacterium]|nr:SUMF1/EgtB/PvdO family nonheme iron enzyme [Alphaproteobacteria bacterium]